jgi:anaerobic ribonucleoside-triphosphate reductase
MKVIKRNGAEVEFDIDKIVTAITKANNAVPEAIRMTKVQIQRLPCPAIPWEGHLPLKRYRIW